MTPEPNLDGGGRRSAVFNFERRKLRKRASSECLLFLFLSTLILARTDWVGLEAGLPVPRLLALLVLYLFFRFLRAGRHTLSATKGVLKVGPSGIVLPSVIAGGLSSVTIPWAKLKMLTVVSSRQGGILILADHKEIYTVHALTLGTWSRFEDLITSIHQNAMVDEATRTALFDQVSRFKASQHRFSGVPRMTFVLLAVIALVFALELILGGVAWNSILSLDYDRIISMGASVKPLVLSGEYGRWFTAVFLHAGWAHVIMNCVGLYFIGAVLELSMGAMRTVLVFLVSGVLAAIASTFLTNSIISVGASGGLFGLLGAVFYLQLFAAHRLPYRLQFSNRAIRVWGLLFALNFGIALAIDQVDHTAHLAGFLVGLLLMLAISPRRGDGDVSAPFVLQVVTVVLCGVFMAFALKQAKHESDSAGSVSIILQSLDPKSGSERQMINRLSWFLALKHDPPRDVLADAHRVMDEVVSLEPSPHYLDTRGTLAHRIGLRDLAIRDGLAAWAKFRESATDLEKIDDGFSASQLLRFFMGLSGPVPIPYEVKVSPGDGTIEVTQGLNGLEDSHQLGLYIGAFYKTGPVGLIHLAGTVKDLSRPNEMIGWTRPELPIVYVVIGESKMGDFMGDRVTQFWPYDPDVAALPPAVFRPELAPKF